MRRAFGASLPTDEELAVARETTEFDRTLAFFDGAEIVATAGIFSYEMTVPGGTLPCGGVTRVSVLTTHRRRGLLTAMMRRQLDDMHERGEPLAALYASEAPIYGRFGYGLGTYQAAVEIERSHAAFAKAVVGGGRLTMVDVPTGIREFTRVWEQARHKQPGMLTFDERWMRNQLADLELHREGSSPHYRVLYRDGDNPTGFAIYRIKMDWDASGPNGTLRLEMLVAATAEAYAALWRHVLDVDLMARVTAEMRPVEEPLRFLLADSRQPKTRIEDGVWLRLVDVAAALLADGILNRHVCELHSSAGPQHAKDLCEDSVLVRNEIDDAVGDDNVDARVAERKVLDLTLDELDVFGPQLFRSRPGSRQHLQRHVDPGDVAVGPDHLSGDE